MKPPLSKQSIVDVLGFWLSQVMLIKTGIHHSMVDSSCGKNHVRTIRRLRQAQVGLNISLVDGWCVPIESCSPGGVRFGCNLFSLIKRYGVLLVTHAAYLGPEGYDIYHIYVIYIYNITYYIYYVYIYMICMYIYMYTIITMSPSPSYITYSRWKSGRRLYHFAMFCFECSQAK